ncbi:hypothetical protein Q4599_17210 [Cellulophaga lytica]|uniref:hypothetical protein n=1 Tax=Cellulophaga lytica TaxID=979 RepID=UPI0026E1DE7B|nr:hypothetical protein [Cellulophaga lytica]MDO6855324.1 hypothetical protein [Cellulophaga lytica]
MTHKFNLDTYVDSIAAQVKHYPKEPIYYLRINQLNCIYEILVNGEIVTGNYSLMQYASATEINRAILKSGPQTITYRLYPVGDLVKDEIGEGETITTLLNSTEISIDVIRVDDINTYESITDDEKLVVKHQSKKNKETGSFIGAGLPYYEHTFTFNAQVPYELEGWTNGIDLRKLDQKKLEQAVVAEYKKIQKLYEAKDVVTLLDNYYHSFVRLAVSEYKGKQYIKEMVEEIYKPILIDNKDFQPIRDYKFSIWSQGHYVSLEHPVFPIKDKRIQGKPSFWFLFKNSNGRLRAMFRPIDLSIPKDKHKEGEFNFEFAR